MNLSVLIYLGSALVSSVGKGAALFRSLIYFDSVVLVRELVLF